MTEAEARRQEKALEEPISGDGTVACAVSARTDGLPGNRMVLTLTPGTTSSTPGRLDQVSSRIAVTPRRGGASTPVSVVSSSPMARVGRVVISSLLTPRRR